MEFHRIQLIKKAFSCDNYKPFNEETLQTHNSVFTCQRFCNRVYWDEI